MIAPASGRRQHGKTGQSCKGLQPRVQASSRQTHEPLEPNPEREPLIIFTIKHVLQHCVPSRASGRIKPATRENQDSQSPQANCQVGSPSEQKPGFDIRSDCSRQETSSTAAKTTAAIKPVVSHDDDPRLFFRWNKSRNARSLQQAQQHPLRDRAGINEELEDPAPHGVPRLALREVC